MDGVFFSENAVDYDRAFLFFVEGKDDAIVLELLFTELRLSPKEVGVVICGGKSNIRRHLNLASKSISFYRKVRSIAVVRDADDSIASALTEVHSDLKQVGFPLPGAAEILEENGKKFGVYFFPGLNKAGDLEDLAIEMSSGVASMKLAQDYILNAQQTKPTLTKLSKRKIQAFLAASSDEIRPTVGWAFRDGTISFSAAKVPELRDFVIQLTS
jgi:predicted ATP-dependent endonuclease of OLD family